MSKFTDFETIITMAGKEVAVGRELKYFWDNDNAVITKHRNNFRRTLLELHSKKRLSDKIATAEGDYQVREYSIPNIEWVKMLVNYSHRVYLTSVGNIDEIYLDATTRPLRKSDKVEGEVLSPDAWLKVLKQISQYNNDWESTTEISKNEISFVDLHGIFDKEGNYYVMNRDGNRTFSQFLGIQIDEFTKYGTSSDKLSDEALVRAITSINE